jgi:hypothetical protein
VRFEIVNVFNCTTKKKKSGARITNLQQKIYAGSTYTKNIKLEFPINTISQRPRSYMNSIKRISVPIQVLHPANSLVTTICFQTATYVPVSLSDHAYCSNTLSSYVTWHPQCTALRFRNVTKHSSSFQQTKKKSSDTVKFLHLIAHDNIKKVSKRVTCFKHNSNTPTIPDYRKGIPTALIVVQIAHLLLCRYCCQNSLSRYLRSHHIQLHYSATRLTLHNFRM